jgi:hypothetical protein
MELRDMKKFIFSSLAVIGVFAFISCERHDWEDSAEGKKDGTKNLYPKEAKKAHGKEADAHAQSKEQDGHEGHNH